jgi:hypothetical protein
MNYSNVTNCKYVSSNGLHIGCRVTFDTLGSVYFVASANDTEAHGREIYQRANSGEFGAVVEYVQPNNELTLQQKEDQARLKRNQQLLQIDAIVSNPLRWADLSSQVRDEIATYRTALLNVPQQSGFPLDIEWPEVPTIIADSITSVELSSENIIF